MPALHSDAAFLLVAEYKEFSGFLPKEQRYIKRSLDIGLNRCDYLTVWPRNSQESRSIVDQEHAYKALPTLRMLLPDEFNLCMVEAVMGSLIAVSAFDLAQEKLTGFSTYRYLYERLLGPGVRPWLPGAFCAAAALPHIRPEMRSSLLQSISQAAATAPGWSMREPMFLPEWVDKDPL